MKAILIAAATKYDARQAKSRYYNPYALGQYLMRIDEICADIERGADPAAAIARGFTGTLRNALLKAAGVTFTGAEDTAWHYRPVTK